MTNIEKKLKEMQEKEQAKLPEEDRLNIHGPMCKSDHHGYACTKPYGHSGDHVAHNIFGMICQRWPA